MRRQEKNIRRIQTLLTKGGSDLVQMNSAAKAALPVVDPYTPGI